MSEELEPFDNNKLGRNEHTFSSDNQPMNGGRKKTKHIVSLMREMGRQLAPEEIRNDKNIKPFLDQLGFKGTIQEAMIARLYSLALMGDTKALKLALDMLNGDYGGKDKGVVINFVSPSSHSSIEVGPDGELTSDPWTLAPGPN